VRIPPDDYLRDRVAQLESALDRRDGELAVAIIGLVEADGYDDFAHEWTRRLVEAGLNNVAAGRNR
jgi:hypothetical protein